MTKLSSKKMLLTALIEATVLPQSIEAELRKLPWDSNVAEVVLSRAHVNHILSLYLAGTVSQNDVERWANSIEGRDDIGYESGYERLLNEVVYQLANPLMTQFLTPESALSLRESLQDNLARS
jgi:hypothetical protein